MLALIAILLLLGLAALWLARQRRLESGLPAGRVVYFDTVELRPQESPLYDPRFDLTGRPDYLVERNGTLLPVEVKSGRAPVQPHEGHLLQLAAYCHLVEAVHGVRPPYGVIKYRDRAYAIDYDERLREALLEVLAQMRRMEGRQPSRSHDEHARCGGCGYRQSCDQSLVGPDGERLGI